MIALTQHVFLYILAEVCRENVAHFQLQHLSYTPFQNLAIYYEAHKMLHEGN